MSSVIEDTRHPERESTERGLASLLGDWFSAYGDRMVTGVRLVLAETRLAVTTFILMVFVVVLAAFAVMFAWGLLMFAGVRAFSLAGMPLISAAMILCALHVLLALALWRVAGKLGEHLEFEATRKLLGSDS